MSARGEEFAEFGLKPPRDEFAEKNLISWGIDLDDPTVKDPGRTSNSRHNSCPVLVLTVTKRILIHHLHCIPNRVKVV